MTSSDLCCPYEVGHVPSARKCVVLKGGVVAHVYDVKDPANRDEVLAAAQDWTDWDVTVRARKFVRDQKVERSKKSGCGSNGPAMRAEPVSLAAAEEFDRRLTWQCYRHGLAALYRGRLGRQASRGLEPTYETGRWDILPLKKAPAFRRSPASELLRVSDFLFTVTAGESSASAQTILVNGRELYLTVTQPGAGSRDPPSDWGYRGRALSLVKSCSDEEFDLRAADDKNPPRPSP